LTALGLGIGIVGSLVLRLIFRSTTTGIAGGAMLDPGPYWRAALALTVVGVVATYLPARRASSANPTAALRND
jgi:ABC-type antimicrobial peptide transport system permease subunit